MEFSNVLEENTKKIKQELTSDDVIFYDFLLQTKKCTAIYIDSLIDKKLLGDLVISPLKKLDESLPIDELGEKINNPQCKAQKNFDDAIEAILLGNALILFDGSEIQLTVDIKKVDQRAVSEPPTSTVLKGPREGFNESVQTNLSLLRKRLKSKDLKVEYMTIGRYSKTTVAICYVDSICDLSVLKQLKSRIGKLDIDGISDSSYVAKQIVEHKTSLFKQVGNTEKPDILMAKMLEGRIGIIVDGSPIALTVPYLIIEDFQSSEDYFKSYYRANFERWLRLISVIFAVYLPALFVAAQLFHLQLIPLNFLLTIINSIKGIPLSPSLEMFFTLLIFEMLNEASIRMPKYIGMALSIIGALVVGETAVRAGIVSSPSIMIMALSGICLYTVPELTDTMSILRLMFLIIAGATGLYGILLATCFLVLYLCSIENFGVALLAPYAPMVKSDLKDSFYMTYTHRMKKRPESLKSKNKTRMTEKVDQNDEKEGGDDENNG